MNTRQQDLIAKQCAKGGMRGRVNAFCISCIYDEVGGGGTWREQVEACTAPNCPLFPIRPVSRPDPRVRG